MRRLLLPFFLVLFFLVISFTLLIHTSFARITPEDIVNQQREDYQSKVNKYSQSNRKKLEDLSAKIASLNKKATDQYTQVMDNQALILDEYQKRLGGGSNQATENARYWLTFAHEAVAYQAAKIYIFSLTNETNLKGDANLLISQLQSDISTLRGKVIKSQNIIRNLLLSSTNGGR
ncbi:hypothetical protein HYS93_01790 [Candidatus Daviesbacteria bacterium]|nr:hypothetical protein [Candidatus Daviesbacteria bacterium]